MMKLRRIIGHVLAVCLLSAHCFALDPSRALTQYGHTAWRIRDGYFPSAPLAIAQTKDGQLWLGGEGGLLHFDGVQFSPWRAPNGQPLPDERIFALLGASDGSLWIGTGSGLARWKDGRLVSYASAGRFASIVEDPHGTIWAGHTRAVGVVPPLCTFAGNDFKCFAFSDQPLPGSAVVTALAVDHQGDLWIGTHNAICRWHQGEKDCYVVPGSNPLGEALGVESIAIDSADVVWLDGGVSGIWQFKSGRWKHYDEFPQLKLQLTASLLDPRGGLWFGDPNHGIIRHLGGRVERFDRADGLSGDTITAMFEDREGSVWVGTSAGLDRFRDVKVATITQREGLPTFDPSSIASSQDGGLWIAGRSELARLRMGNVASYEVVRGLPENAELGAAFEDSGGRVWAGVGNVIAWRQDAQFHQVPSLKLSPVGQRVRAIVEDVDGTIWASTTDIEVALVRIGNGRVLEKFTREQLGQQITAMVANPAGGVWVSRGSLPGLILARGGKFERHADGFPSDARNMFADSDGLWASTGKGAVLFRNGTVSIISVKNGLPCDTLDAAVKDDSGALWLKGGCGLMQISAPELALWMKDPTRQVQFRYFDAFDGVQAGAATFLNVAKTADGRLWFALGQGGIQVVDPRHLEYNPIPPPVVVLSFVADHRTYPLLPELRLPAHTRDIEINYTAYSFVAPEKMRFRYRLEGIDASWQEVGTRRQAYFSNLKPRRYRFEVSASNNDGVWNEAGSSLDFSITPAWYQTIWFYSASAGALVLLLWAFHHLRLRQLAHQYSVRLDERVNERTRIARDLHDTMLQSFQGVLMKFYSLTYLLDQPAEAREKLKGFLEQGQQAINEGREAVLGLRSSTVITNDLARALTTLGEELAAEQDGHNSVAYHVEVEGRSRDLHPILRDEVYRIAGEAVRNAFRHACASRIGVGICYDERQFRVRICDNGKGIDPAILEGGGRAGHYGLAGMQERARSVGGKLALSSKPDCGTETELTIPASLAYTKSRRTPR
jgi:signal transduction histidine kinase/ligand-binding sensor domain-containing protein